MDFDVIATGILTILEERGMDPAGLGMGFTYPAAAFDDTVANANKDAVLNRMLFFNGLTKGVQWSTEISRKWIDSEGNPQPGFMRLPKDPLAAGLTTGEKRLIEEILYAIHRMLLKHAVPFVNFDVTLVLPSAEFDRLFQSQEGKPVLERGIRHHITIDEGQGKLQVTRAVEAGDLS